MELDHHVCSDENIADIDRSKERDSDITADKLVALKLAAVRVQESAKAAGLPEGKSTDAVSCGVYTSRVAV